MISSTILVSVPSAHKTINLRIIMKNHAVDSQIGFRTKSILKPYGRVAAIPMAWEL